MYLFKNKKKFFKKIFTLGLLLILIPSFSFAEPVSQAAPLGTNTSTASYTADFSPASSSGNAAGAGGVSSPNGSSDRVYSGAGSAVAGGTASCAVGQLLANLVTSTVGSAISSLTGKGTSAIESKVTSAVSLSVPVSDSDTHAKVDTTNNNLYRLTSAQVGGGQTSSFLGGSAGGLSNSWNSIAFCIANEMIRYIGNSTIDWIKNGFHGKPVFVDNPSKFFGDIADQEAAGFIRQIVGQTAGIDVCQPFRVQLAVDQIGSRGSGSGLNCSLSSIKNNYQGFVGGDFKQGGLPGWFELIQPQNNYWGAKQIAQNEALINISTKQNTALVELNWAKGYKSFKVCNTTPDANGDCKYPNGKSAEQTTTLGGYIENAVNVRGASANHRLEIANTFDGVVSALVNELIKIAINKTFESDASVDNVQPLSAYCVGAPLTPTTGDPVTWRVDTYGGTGSYSYFWSGDAVGDGASITGSYSIPGVKTANVSIISGTQTINTTCSINVAQGDPTLNTTIAAALTPTSGNPNTLVSISGSKFLSSSFVVMKNENLNIKIIPTTGDAYTLYFTIPSAVTNTACATSSDPNCQQILPVTDGVYEVFVQNEDGTKSNALSFTVGAVSGGGTASSTLSVSSLTPTTGAIGTDVIISGANFSPLAQIILNSSPNIELRNIELVLAPTALGASSLTFKIPALIDSNTPLPNGVYEIRVKNSDTSVSSPLNFTVTN